MRQRLTSVLVRSVFAVLAAAFSTVLFATAGAGAAPSSSGNLSYSYDLDVNDARPVVVQDLPSGQGLSRASGITGESGGSRHIYDFADAFVAPRGVHASDLVDSPLWTSTKKGSSAENALRHFNDHGADFPDVHNALEYAAKAQDFLRTPPGGTLTRVRANGDVVRYHPGSNTFGVMDATAAPRTFFRPDPTVHGYPTNMDYFYAQ